MSIAKQNAGVRAELIAFTGSTPNIGTTVAAFGAAVWMARLTGRRVGYLCLNLKSSKIHRYLGCSAPRASLDGLRPELKAGRVDGSRLERQCMAVKGVRNLLVLPGNMQREQAEYYTLADMDCLLSAAAERFDYVLVDCSAYWDNAATIAALRQAGQRVMVTTQQLGHFQEDVARWCAALSPVFGLSASSFAHVVTQCAAVQPDGFDVSDVCRETGMTLLGAVAARSELPRLLGQGRLLEAINSRRMLRDFKRLADTLLAAGGERAPIAERTSGRLAALLKWKPSSRRGVYGR